MGIFSTGSLHIKDENGIFSIWSDKDITITNQGDSMSTQSKIDEIERGGVKKSTNCRQEKSGHSPIVICENKQEEFKKLYEQLEKEQAEQRRLKEQEEAAKAERLRKESEAKAKEEAEKLISEAEKLISKAKSERDIANSKLVQLLKDKKLNDLELHLKSAKDIRISEKVMLEQFKTFASKYSIKEGAEILSQFETSKKEIDTESKEQLSFIAELQESIKLIKKDNEEILKRIEIKEDGIQEEIFQPEEKHHDHQEL